MMFMLVSDNACGSSDAQTLLEYQFGCYKVSLSKLECFKIEFIILTVTSVN